MIMLHLIFSVPGDQIPPWMSVAWTTVFLYVGPDQLLPLTSFLGALLGILLIFWNRAVAFVRRMWQFFTSK